jgi:plastocyanin
LIRVGEVPTVRRVPAQTFRLAALACGALTLLLPATSALGADAAVTVADKAFTPPAVTITAGESVTWSWSESGHNVRVTDGPATFDSGFKNAGGTYVRAFPAAGTYRYLCDAHPDMRGTVTVGGAGAGAGAGAPAPAAAAPSAGATPGPAPRALRLSAVSVSRLGVVRLRATTAGRLRARLVRGSRVVKGWTLPLAAGANRLPLAVRRVPLGRYRLELHALDERGRAVHRLRRSVVVTRAARARRTVPAPQPIAAPAPAPRAPAPAPEPPPAPAGDAPDDSDGRVRPEDSSGGARAQDDR